MSIDALVLELRRRYSLLDAENMGVDRGRITEDDIVNLTGGCAGKRADAFDELARHLALAFHERRLPFEFCDAVMNDLHSVICFAGDMRPDFFWKVFLAFDGGEFHRRHDKSDDPVADFTEPAIAAIIADL
jgi:hypothetical protein